MRRKRCCAFEDGCADNTGPGTVRRLTNCNLTSTLPAFAQKHRLLILQEFNPWTVTCGSASLHDHMWVWRTQPCCQFNKLLDARSYDTIHQPPTWFRRVDGPRQLRAKDRKTQAVPRRAQRKLPAILRQPCARLNKL